VLEQKYEELERLFLKFDLRTLLSNVSARDINFKHSELKAARGSQRVLYRGRYRIASEGGHVGRHGWSSITQQEARGAQNRLWKIREIYRILESTPSEIHERLMTVLACD